MTGPRLNNLQDGVEQSLRAYRVSVWHQFHACLSITSKPEAQLLSEDTSGMLFAALHAQGELDTKRLRAAIADAVHALASPASSQPYRVVATGLLHAVRQVVSATTVMVIESVMSSTRADVRYSSDYVPDSTLLHAMIPPLWHSKSVLVQQEAVRGIVSTLQAVLRQQALPMLTLPEVDDMTEPRLPIESAELMPNVPQELATEPPHGDVEIALDALEAALEHHEVPYEQLSHSAIVTDENAMEALTGELVDDLAPTSFAEDLTAIEASEEKGMETTDEAVLPMSDTQEESVEMPVMQEVLVTGESEQDSDVAEVATWEEVPEELNPEAEVALEPVLEETTTLSQTPSDIVATEANLLETVVEDCLQQMVQAAVQHSTEQAHNALAEVLATLLAANERLAAESQSTAQAIAIQALGDCLRQAAVAAEEPTLQAIIQEELNCALRRALSRAVQQFTVS